jgi:AcrR family transcriptional regulator
MLLVVASVDRTPSRPSGDAAQRLLDAAIDSFADVGYHATTTRGLADRAGMSPAAVYVHYASKLELLHTISRIGHEDARRCLEEALAVEGTHRERVENGIREFAAWHAENQTIARVVQYEYRALPAEAREDIKVLRREMQAHVEDAIRRGVESGWFVVDDVSDAALAIVSMCVDIARWYSSHERRSPRELGEIYAGLSMRLLGADVAVEERDVHTAAAGA